MKVKELIKELKQQNQNAPVHFWDDRKGYIDIWCGGQDDDEINYQTEYKGLTREQALEQVCVELHEGCPNER
jgi:hypothetical protein